MSKRGDHRVDEARLARARRAGDEQVGHLGETRHDEAAFDILAETDRHGVDALDRRTRAQHIAERDDLAVLVRDLHADRAFARDRRKDVDLIARDRVADVLGERGDALNLHAGAEFDLVPRNRGAPTHAGDPRIHLELLEHFGDCGDDLVVGGAARLGRRSRPEYRRRRQSVRRRLARPCAGQFELACPALLARLGGEPGKQPWRIFAQSGRAGRLDLTSELLDRVLRAHQVFQQFDAEVATVTVGLHCSRRLVATDDGTVEGVILPRLAATPPRQACRIRVVEPQIAERAELEGRRLPADVLVLRRGLRELCTEQVGVQLTQPLADAVRRCLGDNEQRQGKQHAHDGHGKPHGTKCHEGPADDPADDPSGASEGHCAVGGRGLATVDMAQCCDR